MNDKNALNIKNHSIIYIEDEEDQCDAFYDQLYKEFNVLYATSAEEAINLIASEKKLAVLLVDHFIPGMCGTDLVLELKNQPNNLTSLFPGTEPVSINKNVKCILLSNNVEPQFNVGIENQGIWYKILRKPVDFSDHRFKELLKNAIETHIKETQKVQFCSLYTDLKEHIDKNFSETDGENSMMINKYIDNIADFPEYVKKCFKSFL